MKAEPFPISVIPDPLAGFITEGAEAIGCDQRYLALPSLAGVAGAIGNTRMLRLKRSWREPAVVWTASVGESGTLKTPAMKLAMEPIYRHQRKVHKEYSGRKAAYENELKAWKSKPKDQRDDEPEKPDPMQHVFCSDITTEALAGKLEDSQRGLMIVVDELSGLFARFDRYSNGGGDVQHYLTMHGAGTLKVDRKTGDRNTLYVPHAAVSITGGIQPAILRQVLSREFYNNGLAARLLLAMPDSSPSKWSDKEVSESTYAALDRMYDNLFALGGEQDENGDLRPTDIALLPDARERFIEFINDHAEQASEMEGDIAAAWSKLKGYAARFALIHHLVRQAAGDEVDPFFADIKSVESGIALAEWFWKETKRVYALFSQSDDERDESKLLDLIYEMGGRVTPRAVKERSRRYPTSEAAEVALNALAGKSMGVWQVSHDGQRGRPVTEFVLADSPDRPCRSAPVNHNSNGKPHLVERGTPEMGVR